jgi:hypothetical protein
MWGHYGSKAWESNQGPLTRRQARLPISYGGIGLLFKEFCAPFTFLGSCFLVAPYLCSRFFIFNKPVLEEYVY